MEQTSAGKPALNDGKRQRDSIHNTGYGVLHRRTILTVLVHLSKQMAEIHEAVPEIPYRFRTTREVRRVRGSYHSLYHKGPG